MPRVNNLQMALVLIFAAVLVTVCSFAAEEKGKPGALALNAQARREAARKVYEGMVRNPVEDPESVRYDLGDLHDWSVRWMQAERDLARTKVEKIAAIEGHLKRMEVRKSNLDTALQQRRAAAYTAGVGEFFRLEAEAWLAEAQAEPE